MGIIKVLAATKEPMSLAEIKARLAAGVREEEALRHLQELLEVHAVGEAQPEEGVSRYALLVGKS